MKPLVSVILPTLNEGANIDAALCSLLGQKQEEVDLEILVIDGASSDDTVARVRRFLSHPRIKLLHNPARSTPTAFNVGLRAAAGEYVCILGAHAKYKDDYIETCYREMLEHDATGCSGQVHTVPASNSISAKLAAWCLSNSFASSPNSVRTQSGGYVETVAYPLFRKADLLALGGYNEQLGRNQDNDMNYRLRQAGHRLYLTSKTRASYVARKDITSLLTYAHRTGKWNAYTLAISPGCMRLRHFLAFIFLTVAATLGISALCLQLAHGAAWLPFALLVVLFAVHLLMGTASAVVRCFKERSALSLLLPPVILGFHLAYGMGTLTGFLSPLTPSNSAPAKARATLST